MEQQNEYGLLPNVANHDSPSRSEKGRQGDDEFVHEEGLVSNDPISWTASYTVWPNPSEVWTGVRWR